MNLKRIVGKLALAALVAFAFPISAVQAVSGTYAADTDLAIAGATLKIKAGSQADSLITLSDGFTVTVAADEAFIIRYPGTSPRVLENDALLPTCKVLRTQENQLVINGPRTVTVRPSQYACSTVGYDADQTPLLEFVQPTAGTAVKSGDSFQVFWQTQGASPAGIKMRLSTDGGVTFPLVVANDVINNGFYAWTVPSVATTDHARLKLEGRQQGNIVAMAVSPEFRITGDAASPVVQPPAQPQSVSGYAAEAATRNAETIDKDRNFVAPTGTPAPECPAGLRIKARGTSSVYFCGADGKRHPFPNQKIHDSWYAGDFAGVYEVSADALGKISLGKNVTYRPGVRMVKVTTDPKVYAVDADGTLRWITSESVAVALYGQNWNQQIDDLPDAFFFDYKIGTPIE